MAFIRNSEWRDDEVLYAKAEVRQPKSSIIHNDLGEIYQKKGLYDKALGEYEKSIRLNSKNHIAWLNLGTLYGELGNYTLAIYHINRSLSIYGSYKAHNNLGLVYDQARNHDKAIAELQKAIEFNPHLTKAHMDIATVYAKRGNFDKAFEEFNTALKLNPQVADIHYNLGILYEYLNDSQNAALEFTLAYRLDRDSNIFKSKYLQYGQNGQKH